MEECGGKEKKKFILFTVLMMRTLRSRADAGRTKLKFFSAEAFTLSIQNVSDPIIES